MKRQDTVCRECGGTGWTTYSGDEGGAVARRCDCFKTTRIERLIEAANIPKRYEHCEIVSFDPEPSNSHQKGLKKKAEEYAKDFPTLKHGLLFLGSCGTGKTHLAIGILKEVIRLYRVNGLFFDFRNLLKEIQSSYNEVSKTSEKAVLQPVLKAELLVLDDLGSEKPSAWVDDTLAFIINYRYNEMHKTIITSNFLDSPHQEASGARGETFTERIGARLRSRLYEMCEQVYFSGKDFRKEIKAVKYRKF